MKILPEFAIAVVLMVLGLIAMTLVSSPRWSRFFRITAVFVAIFVCVGGLLLRGATGRGPDDYASDYATSLACAHFDWDWLCDRRKGQQSAAQALDAWNAVAKSDPTALRAFKGEYGHTEYAELASALLSKLDREAWQAATREGTALAYGRYAQNWQDGLWLDEALGSQQRLSKRATADSEKTPLRKSVQDASQALSELEARVSKATTADERKSAAQEYVAAFLAAPRKTCVLKAAKRAAATQLAQSQPDVGFIFDRSLQRKLVDISPAWPRGFIVVSWCDRALYYVISEGQAIAYPIAGVPDRHRTHKLRVIASKDVNPAWTPSKEALASNPKIPSWVPGGHPMNPLGVRVLRFQDSRNDDDTIHGTDAPWTIDGVIAEAAIRMYNEDILDLFPRVSVGANVVIHTQGIGFGSLADPQTAAR